MKLLVLNYEYPPLGGGASNATCFLARAWASAGHEVTIVTSGFKGYPTHETGVCGEKIWRLNTLRKRKDASTVFEMISYIVFAFFAVRKIAAQQTFDHCISFFAIPSGIIALGILYTCRIPYTILLRGGDVPGFLPQQLSTYHTILLPLISHIWKKAHSVIANSSGLQLLAQKTAKKINVDVAMVPNGVDTVFFFPAHNTLKKTFLFVGRFVQQKNCMLILKEFNAFMKKYNPNATLCMIGDGPMRNELIEYGTTCESAASITFCGWSIKDDLKRHYQEAFCFVNPSSEEGMSNTMLEAMACGLPLITTNVRGNNELCVNGENGVYVSLQNPNSLCEAFRYMWCEADCESMKQASRKKAELFSWEISAEKILQGITKKD